MHVRLPWFHAGWIGRTTEVVIDERDAEDPAQWLGRTSADCPEVDGAVYVRHETPLSPGTFLPVRITDSYEYDLVGTAAGPPDQPAARPARPA